MLSADVLTDTPAAEFLYPWRSNTSSNLGLGSRFVDVLHYVEIQRDLPSPGAIPIFGFILFFLHMVQVYILHIFAYEVVAL